MPLSSPTPTIFCAPTLAAARRAAWQWISSSGASSALDPPRILGADSGFVAWRMLATEQADGALVLPRLSDAESYFARSQSANARQTALRGTKRLWALAHVLRGLESRFNHIEFDADDTDALRAMAALLARMRRGNETRLPVGDDGFGGELDEWRSAYDRHLGDICAFDYEAAPALFARNPEVNRAFAFPTALIVDDGCELTPAMQLGLDALIARARAVCGVLALPNGFEDDVAARARAYWEKHGAHFEWSAAASSPRLRAARALLGAPGTPDDLPADVSLTQAHTPHDEWERIAALIRARLDGGAHPTDFCLVVPDHSSQIPVARAAFRAHGVPLPDEPMNYGASPLVERLLRVLTPRPAWSVDELHDLFGDGTLSLRWTTEDGATKQFNAGRLRRAHRCNRGESDEAAWRDPVKLAIAWELELRRAKDAGGKADQERADLLARSLDGGDLEGVARLKTLLAPFAKGCRVGEWKGAALAVIDELCRDDGGGNGERGVDEAARLAKQALAGLRKGIEGVVERADEDDEREAGRWLAWLRVELAGVHLDEEFPVVAGASVRVLRVGQVGDAGSEGETDIFVPGLTERAWPAHAPKSQWPATTAKALERLRTGEPEPLALALHGLAHLLAGSARLHLSFPAWQSGDEVQPSPLVEDLRALFPHAKWPELPCADSRARPTSRALWLRHVGVGETPRAPHLVALDSMRRERTNPREFGRYDGVLGAGAREQLRGKLHRPDGQLELSASGAETYARCGIRFFFERVLALGDEERAEDDLTRAESGDLVHRILHHFQREWSEPLGGNTFERARLALEAHVRRECARLMLPPILRRAEARRLLGTPTRDGALVRVLRAECREADALVAQGKTVFTGAFHPLVHLQSGAIGGQAAHGFALNIDDGRSRNGLEQAFEIPLSHVTLRGRIDRIDASPDGARVRVLDYKTGSASSLPTFNKHSDRLHFQLAIYVEAAAHLAVEWHPSPDVVAAYLSPRKGFAGVSPSGTARQQWLDDTRAQLERIGALIEEGTFNLSLRSPEVARCKWCPHSSLCGQNPAIQTARAAIHEGSNVVFFPPRIEWE